MAFVFHKERKKDVHEESIKVEVKEKKVRELDKCKVQLTDEEETLKSQEGSLRVVEKDKKRKNERGCLEKETYRKKRKHKKIRRKETIFPEYCKLKN